MHSFSFMRFLFPISFLFVQGLWASPIWLKVGEVRSLPASPSAVVRIGTRGIVRIVESGRMIQIVGLKSGVTAIAVDDKSYLIQVSRSSEKNFFESVREEISKMKGLRLVSDTQPVEIHGTLLRFRDWSRLSEIAREHHGRYLFKAQAHPDAAVESLRHFKKLTAANGLPILRYSADPQFTAHIPGGRKDLTESAEETFGTFGIRVSPSPNHILVQPLIRTHVVLAELSRNRSHEFGIEWPAVHQGQILPKASASENLLMKLKALESQGDAQILASPTLLCRSGSSANFHAGGEFPIRVISRNTKDVIWKKYGVLLNVKPTADFTGAMSLEVETEVSLPADPIDGVPSLKTNRVKSHFDLIGKRTISLSGLITQEMNTSREGLPLLSNIPILGPLFSTRSERARRSELVIFVTPEIQPPDSDASIEMPKGWVTHEW